MSKHFTPRLSIIVPIYNTEKYLRQCVDSILSQDYTDYELWLIDDGSKDSSIEIIKDYASKDKRIKTAFIHGTGPAMPRNYGLKRAKGEYILFIDSDDYLSSGALSKLLSWADKYPDVTFIKGNQFVLVGDEEKRSVFASWRLDSAGKPLTGDEIVTKVLKTDFTPTNSLIRRDFLQQHNIMFREDIVLLEDVPFIMEICARSTQTLYSPVETYIYRLESETSLTRSKRTLPKVISLASVSGHEARLSMLFSGDAKDLIERRAIEHSITSLYQAAKNLTLDEAYQVKDAVKAIYPRLPLKTRSLKHCFGVILYNINPKLALFAFRHL